MTFAAPYSGKIIPLDLSDLGGKVICQKTVFLCAAKGVSVGIEFQRKLGTGLLEEKVSLCKTRRRRNGFRAQWWLCGRKKLQPGEILK